MIREVYSRLQRYIVNWTTKHSETLECQREIPQVPIEIIKTGKQNGWWGWKRKKEAESKFIHHNRILFVVNGKQLERDVACEGGRQPMSGTEVSGCMKQDEEREEGSKLRIMRVVWRVYSERRR